MIIGLTGGIGSGKSSVLSLFKEAGFTVFVADEEAKKKLNSDKILIQQVIQLVGLKAYKNGILNRKYIADIIFNNREKLTQLNALIHPIVKKEFLKFVKKSSADFIVYEAAILFESGSADLCDFIITVTADFETKLHRILKRDETSKEAVLARMKNQSTDDFKIKNSHFVINNNGTFKQTKQQVETIITILKSQNLATKQS